MEGTRAPDCQAGLPAHIDGTVPASATPRADDPRHALDRAAGHGPVRRPTRHSSRLREAPTVDASVVGAPVEPARRVPRAAAPGEIPELARRLRALARAADATAAEMLEALARFDELGGWRASGAPHCAAWMSVELDICRALAWEKLRVARALRALPVIAERFRKGDVGWSKVRALTRIATPDTEATFVAVALGRSATDVVRFCEEHRARGAALPDDEAAADAERRARRSLAWHEREDGNVEFRLVLVAEDAMNFRRCLERAEERLFAGQDEAERFARAAGSDRAAVEGSTSDRDGGSVPGDVDDEPPRRSTPAQRGADAAVAMAESSLVADGVGATSAERHQVVVHVDAEALEELVARRGDVAADARRESESESDGDGDGDGMLCASTGRTPDPETVRRATVALPTAVRVALQGGRAITTTSVERLLCDASLVKRLHRAGGESSLGRRTRVWPEPMRRAILDRDGHACRFPGCGATRWLDVHHVTHWLHGGQTSVDNGITCCRGCHRRIHEEGWIIERVTIGAGGDARRNGAELPHGTDEPALARIESRRPRYRFTRPGTRSDAARSADRTGTHDTDRCSERSAPYDATPAARGSGRAASRRRSRRARTALQV